LLTAGFVAIFKTGKSAHEDLVGVQKYTLGVLAQKARTGVDSSK
jgi:hypothetical protein